MNEISQIFNSQSRYRGRLNQYFREKISEIPL